MKPQPLYTAENCTFSCPLQWGLSIFWRLPTNDDGWLNDLSSACEADNIRVLRHRFAASHTSQFLLSTTPNVSPLKVVQRVKGRLQYLLKNARPKAFKGNYAIRSIGKVTRQIVESYVSNQVQHHSYADQRFISRLQQFQIVNNQIRLADPQWTSHGCYWFNLHIALVHRERLTDCRDEVLASIREMIVRSSSAKRYRLSRAGILPDHVHVITGCPIEESPADVALGLLNNLAYVHGMRPIFQYGAFVGTVGEYSSATLQAGTRPRKHVATRTSRVVVHSKVENF